MEKFDNIDLKRNNLKADDFCELHRRVGCDVKTNTIRNEDAGTICICVCDLHHAVSLKFILTVEGKMPYVRK